MLKLYFMANLTRTRVHRMLAVIRPKFGVVAIRLSVSGFAIAGVKDLKELRQRNCQGRVSRSPPTRVVLIAPHARQVALAWTPKMSPYIQNAEPCASPILARPEGRA